MADKDKRNEPKVKDRADSEIERVKREKLEDSGQPTNPGDQLEQGMSDGETSPQEYVAENAEREPTQTATGDNRARVDADTDRTVPPGVADQPTDPQQQRR